MAEVKAEEKKKQVKSEIQRRRNHPLRRLWRLVRATWYWVILIGLAYGCYISAEFLNGVLLVGQQVLRVVSMMSVMILQFVAIFWFMARSKVEIITPEDPKAMTFDDYKGQEKLLELVKQWMSLLGDRKKFREMGGEYINGLLLYGRPGTGKTMLAKCMSGESGTAFISIEGSGFRAMFWGVDVLKMISFIKKARKLAREYGACIAFIDEIDAVGASRGGVMGGGRHTMGGAGAGGMMGGGTGALTRLLYEMDGVGEKTRWEIWQGRLYKLFGKVPPEREWHVLFMGSTNRPGILDSALTRPGRFDRSIEVAPPDRVGRTAIVEYYIGKISTGDDIDIEAIVSDTTGYTPAQIMAAITKDAVRIAMFAGRDYVNQDDIDLAFQEQAMGIENPIEDMKIEQRRQIAYHEAGHAVAGYYLDPKRRIVRATIVRRGEGRLGYVHYALEYEEHAFPLSYYVKGIMISMAGQMSCKHWSGEPWTGPSGDYQSVRNSIYGMMAQGFFGPVLGEPMTGNMKIEKENALAHRFWLECEIATEEFIAEHWVEVEAIALALLEHESLPGRDIVKVIQDVTGEKERVWEDEWLKRFSAYNPTEELEKLDEQYFINETERKKKYDDLLNPKDEDEKEGKKKSKAKKTAKPKASSKNGADGKRKTPAKKIAAKRKTAVGK